MISFVCIEVNKKSTKTQETCKHFFVKTESTLISYKHKICIRMSVILILTLASFDELPSVLRRCERYHSSLMIFCCRYQNVLRVESSSENHLGIVSPYSKTYRCTQTWYSGYTLQNLSRPVICSRRCRSCSCKFILLYIGQL